MAKELPQIVFDFNGEAGKDEKPVPGSDEDVAAVKSRKGRELPSNGTPEIPPDEILFTKQYYPIGEVAQMFHVNISLLRYWEGEFNFKLRKNKKGDRFFTPEDIKTLQLIYDLLRRRKFTLEGAREFLRNAKGADEKYKMIESLQRLRGFLLELKAHL
jgi:DNA-binding transcriptional MerR regulator